MYARFAPLGVPHDITNASNDSSSCPGGVAWMWNIMGDCATTERQQISVYVGLLSMITWMLVGVPQIIKNFRNIDGMAGISFLLLFQWTAGDTTNLIGAILTNQLKPQIYLAIFFVMSDTVLLLEYLVFYVRKVKRKRANSRAFMAASRSIMCLMGLATLTHCMLGSLQPSSSSNVGIGAVSGHHRSRFILWADGDQLGDRMLTGTSGSSPQHASPTFWHNSKNIIGYVIGCVSSVFYLGSRISQILKNYHAKSTDGLAILTFILAVFGNLAYGGQILINDLEEEFLLEHTPWLIGSLGVIGLDCTLLWQFRHYSQLAKQRDEIRRSLLNHDQCIINSANSISQGDDAAQMDRGLQDSLY